MLLDQLCKKTSEIPIDDSQKLVIFSDLHMGKRNSSDDFLPNAQLFMTALREYYLKKGYTLVLNGDVEELHKHALHTIRESWEDVYRVFDEFYEDGRLYKIYGNHDSKLFSFPDLPMRYPLYESIRLTYKEKTLLIFHGHQLSFYYQKFNDLMGLILRYVAKPLRIKNYSVAHDKRKKYVIERRLYEFAKENGIVAIIGHTHRPLFESMSKVDTLNYEIETQLRRYHKVKKSERPEIEDKIHELKGEIERHEQRRGKELSISRLYSNATVVPCVFNSGTVLGKRGVTGIEIRGGRIALVQWFDKNVGKKYIREDRKNTINLEGTDFYRTTLKSDDLDYIFTRIRLLT